MDPIILYHGVFFIFTSDDWQAIAKKKVYSKSEPNYHLKKDEPNLQTAVVGQTCFHTRMTFKAIDLDCRENCLYIVGQVHANNGFVFD